MVGIPLEVPITRYVDQLTSDTTEESDIVVSYTGFECVFACAGCWLKLYTCLIPPHHLLYYDCNQQDMYIMLPLLT